MRRIWLLVIMLGIATIIVLAYTWQNIPYLNTFLIDNGVISAISGVTSGLGDVLNGKMSVSSVIPLVGTAGTIAVGAVKKAVDYVKRERLDKQIKLSDAQSTIGSVKVMAQNTVDTITGAKDQLQGEYDVLLTQKADLEAVVAMKDNAIIDVQSELGKAQAQVIATQNELKTTIKEMDEYRIALEAKALPTTH